MATMAKDTAIALLGVLWPLMALAIALFVQNTVCTNFKNHLWILDQMIDTVTNYDLEIHNISEVSHSFTKLVEVDRK